MLRLVTDNDYANSLSKEQDNASFILKPHYEAYLALEKHFNPSIAYKWECELLESVDDLRAELEHITGLEKALKNIPSCPPVSWDGVCNGELLVLIQNPDLPDIGFGVQSIPFYCFVSFDVLNHRNSLTPSVYNPRFTNYHIGVCSDPDFCSAFTEFKEPSGNVRTRQEFMDTAAKVGIVDNRIQGLANYALPRILSSVVDNPEVISYLEKYLFSHFDIIGREKVSRLYDESLRKRILR